MDRQALRLVVPGASASRPGLAAAACGAVVLAAALAATAAGAGRARTPFPAREIAEAALASQLAQAGGSALPEALEKLRTHLARCPRDAATRTIYASLIAESAASKEAMDAAMAEVRLAVRDDPYGVGVRCAAARVEARCGRANVAVQDIRAIFAFDPGAAAIALSEIEPLLPEGTLEDAIPPETNAWQSWSIRLRELGREGEADARLTDALARWPNDLETRTLAAGVAAGRGRIDDLVRLVPPQGAIPESRETAFLLACRGHSRAETGDSAGARRDALSAAALSDGSPWILAQAGDAVETIDAALARDLWTRALFTLRAGGPGPERRAFIEERLARLDEREGRAADALRRWREVLSLRPASAEARARIVALAGASPP